MTGRSSRIVRRPAGKVCRDLLFVAVRFVPYYNRVDNGAYGLLLRARPTMVQSRRNKGKTELVHERRTKSGRGAKADSVVRRSYSPC